MKCLLVVILLFVLSYTKPVAGFAQELASASIQISGDNLKAFTLTKADFSGMKRITVQATGHDGKKHSYAGVLLSEVLSKAGAFQENSKIKTVRTYLVAKAADNYQTVFALAEVDPAFTTNTIILADQEDEKALPPSNGPFQIIAPGEKKHGRSIRQVMAITLVTAP